MGLVERTGLTARMTGAAPAATVAPAAAAAARSGRMSDWSAASLPTNTCVSGTRADKASATRWTPSRSMSPSSPPAATFLYFATMEFWRLEIRCIDAEVADRTKDTTVVL
jgi:hypothetical protein